VAEKQNSEYPVAFHFLSISFHTIQMKTLPLQAVELKPGNPSRSGFLTQFQESVSWRFG
jgi:hypothetical protein